MRGGLTIVLAAAAATALVLMEYDAGHPPSRFGEFSVRASYVIALLWIITCLVFLWTRARSESGRAAPMPSPPDDTRRRRVIALGVLLALGFLFRSLGLYALPWGYAGILTDATYLSEIAYRILEGEQRFAAVVPSIAYPRDAMLPYYLAGFFGLFGRGIETLRLACNVLAVANWAMVYLILREHCRSALVPLAAVALYAFSDTDAILSISASEYVIVTPLLLATLLLLRRALRSGSSADAGLAGLVWGVGMMAYVAYLGFGAIPLLILAAQPRRPFRWLATFVAGGLLGALPKLVYLAVHGTGYFARVSDVTRHDAQGTFLVWDAFRANLLNAQALLFHESPYHKWLLMQPPLLAPELRPLIALGLVLCVLRPFRPEHLWTLGVLAVALGGCVLTYTVDYRMTNLMPAVFVAAGIGLAWLERVCGGRAVFTYAVILFVGWSAIASIRRYFDVRPSPALTLGYAVDETAFARRVADLRSRGDLVVLGHGLSYRTRFFNYDHPEIFRLTEGIPWKSQQEFSTDGEAMLVRNLTTSLMRPTTPGHAGLSVIIDPTSPYAASFLKHALNAHHAQAYAITVGDGRVSPTRSLLRVIVPAGDDARSR